MRSWNVLWNKVIVSCACCTVLLEPKRFHAIQLRNEKVFNHRSPLTVSFCPTSSLKKYWVHIFSIFFYHLIKRTKQVSKFSSFQIRQLENEDQKQSCFWPIHCSYDGSIALVIAQVGFCKLEIQNLFAKSSIKWMDTAPIAVHNGESTLSSTVRCMGATTFSMRAVKRLCGCTLSTRVCVVRRRSTVSRISCSDGPAKFVSVALV